MKLDLPPPCVDDLRKLRNDRAAIRAALDVKSTLARIVNAMQPETITAIAQQRAPGCTSIEAIGALSVLAAYVESEVEAFNALARAVKAEEAERMRPITEAATRRLFEVMKEIERMPRRIETARTSQVLSVKLLIDAGCSRADAERIAREKNQGVGIAEQVAEMETTLADLIEEKDALQKFLRTKLPEDAPAFLTV